MADQLDDFLPFFASQPHFFQYSRSAPRASPDQDEDLVC